MHGKVKIGISSNALKNIAVVSMVCDHIGYRLIEHGLLKDYDLSQDIVRLLADPSVRNYVLLDAILRGVGRIAYPIFAYLIVVSFLKTRSVYHFLARMLIFAVIAEVPFDLFWARNVINFEHQNVLFTYFLGLLAILCIDRMWKKELHHKSLTIGAVALCIASGYILHVDYDFVGVLVIVLFYIFRSHSLYRDISIVMVLTLQYLLDVISCVSVVLIRICSGEYHKAKRFRYFFYWFYPIHMLILILLEKILF